jgi:methylenetetrahydrofolate dehydrogenase (NADP+)/methenyltetrahydrofolate cyclohydrolase
MTGRIIDGKSIAEALRQDVALQVAELAKSGIVPGLAVVLVGEDPASRVYVANKVRQSVAAGMRSFEHRLPADILPAQLFALVDRLNGDPEVDGILVQLPLPSQIDTSGLIARIDPAKDVDGLHPLNAGRLATGQAGLVPCTPLGARLLLKTVLQDMSGHEAVIVGRSNLVGKPLAQLLLGENCTVTIAHSRTRDLPEICRRADILVAAVGRPEFIRGSWIKPGATVIDVGINRVRDAVDPSKSRLVGDVCYGEAAVVAGAITPVPGGVGPMTIACLLHNTLQAARSRRGMPSATAVATGR